MLIKILGAIDLLAGIFILIALKPVFAFFAVYLIAKAVIFSLMGINVGSFIDFFAGIAFALSLLFALPHFLAVIFGILMIQKGIFSLF